MHKIKKAPLKNIPPNYEELTFVVIVPSPSLSKSSKASLNSETWSSVNSSCPGTLALLSASLFILTVYDKFGPLVIVANA
jgi:hypothetical protein